MMFTEKIRSFLATTNDISLGYSELSFFNVDNLSDGQIGYSIDTNGKSLTNGNDGDW